MVRRSGAERDLGIAALGALPDGADRRLGLIYRLVEQDEGAVCGLEGDPRVLAQLGQKRAVAGLSLLHSLIERIVCRLEQKAHAVGSGDLSRNAGERVVFPCLGLLGLPDGGAEGEAGPLDGGGGGWIIIAHAVQLEIPGGEGSVVPPVFLGEGGTECQLCPRRRRDGPVQPALEPLAIPVLDLDLQVVRLPLLIVRVGDAQEVGLDGVGDVRAVEDDLHLRAAGKVCMVH